MPTKAELLKLKKQISIEDIQVLLPKGTRVISPLPAATNIADMGLSAAQVNKLSPTARKLTKADLVKLWQDPSKPNAKITVQDLNVIRDGFAQQVGKGGVVAMDIYCCCCPCCCATAVVKPAKQVA